MFYKLQEEIRGKGEGNNKGLKEMEYQVNSNSYKDYNAKYQ